MKYEIRLVENYNPPVPSFDSNDKPDLLGWDAAMESYEPDSNVLATANDRDDAAMIASMLADEYDNEEEGSFVTWGLAHDQTEEEPTLIQRLFNWWEDYRDWFCELEEYNLTEVDDQGNPYDWENDNVLYTQVPSYHDFMTIMAHRAARDVFYCNNNLDASPKSKRRWKESYMEDLWTLHDMLYDTDYPKHDNVNAKIKVNVYGAGRDV